MALEIYRRNTNWPSVVYRADRRMAPMLRARNVANALKKIFWSLVLLADLAIIVVLIMFWFGDYSALYWFMDASCGGC